jgi:hypothetical protein
MFIFFSCINHHSKEYPLGSHKLINNLFRETYQTSSGGVFASDTYSDYLTDSISFRKYVGYQHDDEQIRFSMLDDNLILVYKIEIHTKDTLEMDVYSISQLKKEGKFE